MPSIQFKGKSVIETYHHTVAHHRLEFVPKLSVLEKGQKPGLDGNLIIEGDNLLALKALLPTHAGKVKCVYIDPPYNTGNEGWIYNDNLTQPQFKEWIGKEVGKEGEDATRHDKWCCMMWPRLVLLRELMREDGSIWVSIDDNEVQNLRAVMDDVFGRENFIATIIWHKMDSPKNTAVHFSEDHDYIVVYARDAKAWRPNKLPRNEEMIARYKNPDKDPRGPWLLSDLAARNSYDAGRYSIKTPSGKVIPGPPAGSYWRVSRAKFDELDKDGRIWWGETGKNRPGIKRFLSEVQEGVVPQTLWSWRDVGSTRNAKRELSQIMGLGESEDVFITPKPSRLIDRIIHIAADKDSLILDSFAGSGTTGHSVLKLNSGDGGSRRFVLIQNRHERLEDIAKKRNTCQDVTAARVTRVTEGYERVSRDEDGKRIKNKVDGLGGSFSYVRVGDPLFTEYRDLGKKLPPWEDIAKYVFYTETSREIDLGKADEQSGLIGRTPEAGGTAYYLLYTPNAKEDREFSTVTLERIAKAEKGKAKTLVVYCEKIWMHPEEIRHHAAEHGVRVRAMLVPFNLK